MRNTISKLCLSMALVSALASTQALAEIYKWTDENGRVHYSDKKPDTATDVSKMKVSTGKGTPANTSSGNSDSDNAENKEQQLQDKAAQLSQNDAKQADYSKQCEQARANVAKMVDGARLRINDGGQLRFLTPEEITDKRNQNQQFIDEFCN